MGQSGRVEAVGGGGADVWVIAKVSKNPSELTVTCRPLEDMAGVQYTTQEEKV